MGRHAQSKSNKYSNTDGHTEMVTIGSLFAGIGGLDLGLERAGMTCKWQVEIDDYATRVLETHWPDVARFRDVRDCHGAGFCDVADATSERTPTVQQSGQLCGTQQGSQDATCLNCLSPVDLICGGFPCQDVSLAGKRAGLNGKRTTLWSEFARIIRELRPRWVLAENVPGLYSSDSGRFFGRVLGDLAESGYDAEWDCIPAAAVGAPHRRYRVFIVAHAQGSSVGWEGQGDEDSRMGFASSGEGFFGRETEQDVAHAPSRSQQSGCSQRYVGTFQDQVLRAGRHSSYWAVECGVCRMADGLSPTLDGGRIDNELGSTQGGTTINSDDRMRNLCKHRAATTPSSRFEQAAQCDGTLPEMPHGPSCQERDLGERQSKDSKLRDLRGNVHAEVFPSSQNMRPRMFEHSRAPQCDEALASHWADGEWQEVPRVITGQVSRVDRLRCLGNAVVPQVAEWIGRRILEGR